MRIRRTQRGMSLVEVLIAIAVFILFVATLGTVGLSGSLLKESAILHFRAQSVLREGADALRLIRTRDFTLLTLGTHGLSLSGGLWTLTPTPDTANGFTRTVTITSAGAGRLKANVAVAWTEGTEVEGISGTLYINQLAGSKWIQTTEDDFNVGKFNGTETASDGDGALALELHGDWTKPKAFTSYNIADLGTASAMLQVDGVLYVASAAAGTKPLAALDLADAGNGALTLLASTDAGATVKGMAADAVYLYLATDGDAREIVVLRRGDLSPVRVVDLAGTSDVLSVAATGTILYVGRAQSANPELYQFDITNPVAGMPQVRTANYAGGITAIGLTATYLFLGTTANASELSVVRRSDFGTANTLDLTGGADTTAIIVAGNALYLSRTQSSAQEIVGINIADPLAALSTFGGMDNAQAIRALALDAGDVLYAATPSAAREVVAVAVPAFTATQIYDVQSAAGASSIALLGPYVYAGMENSDPEVVALRGGNGQWENPIVKGTWNSPGSANGAAVAVSGNYAYFGSVANGSGPEFVILDVTDSTAPLQRGTLELGAGVNDIAVSGSFAYLASTDNARELIVVNIANPNAPTLVGVYNTPASTDATTVTASGTMVFLGSLNNANAAGREGYIFDVSAPAAPQLRASIELGVGVNAAVFTKYGFIAAATANDAKELIILDPRTPLTLSERTSYNTSGTADARSVAAKDATIVLGTDNNGASADIYLFDQAVNGNVTLSGSSDQNADELGLAISGTLLYAANNLSGAGVSIFNIETPASPILLGTLPFAGVINAVVAGGGYAYGASPDNNREFLIGAPTPLFTDLARDGYFVSSIFDGGVSSPSWGALTWTTSGTGTAMLQTRSADTAANLTGAFWVGSGGVRGGYYATSGISVVVDPLATGQRFIQYRVKLSGDGVTTPKLEDVEIAY